MLLSVKKGLARRLHRILGIDAIRDDVAAAAAAQTRHLLPLFNGLRYAAEPLEAVRSRPEYQRCAKAISLLAPRLIEHAELVRIGGPNDGGYVVLDSLWPPIVTAAYSFGVGGDVSWDRAIAERGVNVFLYDHTVPPPTQLPARCRFTRMGITGTRRDARLRTLSEYLAANGHDGRDDLALKIDVEGAEWDVLQDVSPETLDRFHQIVIEFHDLAGVLDPGKHEARIHSLAKIETTHQPVHVHANCTHLPIWIGDLVLPQVLEVTYVRRRDVSGRIQGPAGPFPAAIDQPNLSGWPDVYLGWFGGERPG